MSYPEDSAPRASTQPKRPGFLERPGRRRRLQIECARAEKTGRELAREYGVNEASIREFKDRHSRTIAEIARDLENEFAGLWIAQKTDRISEYQELFEGDDSPRDRETRAAMLRQVAEELGQIPNKTTIDFAQPIEIKLIGVDPEDV